MPSSTPRLIRCARYEDGAWMVHYMDRADAPCIASGRAEALPEWFTTIWTAALIGGHLTHNKLVTKPETKFSLLWCYVTPEFELVRFHPL